MTSSTSTLPTPAHSVNGSVSQPDAVMADESPNKRKRALDDLGDRDHKKLHLEESKPGIEDLHRDVGEKYLLCQTRKAPSAALFPLPSRNRISTVLGTLLKKNMIVNAVTF